MLFDPYVMAGIRLANRIVRSATYEKRADDDGFATDFLIELYEDLVRGGAGLIITGNTLVHPSGRTVQQMLSIHSDMYIKNLKRLTSAVHDLDGVIAMQLVHGGRQSLPMLLGGQPAISPSEVYEPVLKVEPRAMTDEEIWSIIEAFGEAARRARDAGFDAVQIHGAHGYLVSQFLSGYTNRRDDYWGGDEERRFHFVEEVYKAMRKNVGEDFPIMIKMNSEDFLPGGLTPEESVRAAWRLESMGMDAVEVSGGMIEAGRKTAQEDILEPAREAYFHDAGKLFKQRLRIPVMLVGGMRTRHVMEDVLKKEYADMISMSRPLIREPDLPKKMLEGKEGADCVSCNKCMKFGKLDYVRCVKLKRHEEKEED